MYVTTWMDLEEKGQTEKCQTEKNKYCMISLISGTWGKKKKTDQ